MFRIIVMALVMLCCGVAVADDYTESGGYFWQGDKAYTRTQVKYKRYTHTRGNCRYYVWDTKWEYTFHHEREKPAPVVVTPDKEPDEGYTGTQRLKSELIALAADRHKWQHKLETSQQENKELLELIDALGLKGYAQVNQVYQHTNPGAYKLTSKFNTTQGPFAQQGNTLYGYNAFAPRYSEVDIQVGFTQQAELAKNMQSLAGKTTGDFSALLAQQMQIYGELDNKQITTEQLERVLKAVNELVKERPIATESEVTVEPVQPATPSEQAPPPPGLAPLSAAEHEQLLQVIESRCVKCHSPEDKSGGWDLTQYASYSQQQKYQVVQSLTGKGPKGKAMPLNEAPLSEQESMLLLRDYVSGNQ